MGGSISKRLGEIKQFRKSEFSKLEEIVIEVTFECNLGCYFCFNLTVLNGNMVFRLSTKQIKEVIDKAAELNIPFIRFSGGEPLLREDIFDLLAYAKSKKFKEVRLNTNGLLINEYVAKKLEKYVDNVLIAINACSSEQEKKITGVDSFNKRINALKLLKKTKIKIVRGGTIALPENIKNLEKIYSIVRGLKLDDWEVYRPIANKSNLGGVTRSDVKVLVQKLLKIKKETGKTYPIANALPFCVLGKGNICNVAGVSLGAKYDDGHCRLVIDPRGYIKPSYFINENLGGYLEIEKAWNSVFLKKIRGLSFIEHECNCCNYLGVCKGGSRFDSYLKNGDYFKEDSLFNL